MAGTLNSDHVNYLIWRYLQEHGYPHTAVQLMRDWGVDPQKLAFAPMVGPYELISMLQDGLVYDELQAVAQSNLNGSVQSQPQGLPTDSPSTAPSKSTSKDRRRYGFVNVLQPPRMSAIENNNDAALQANLAASRKRPRLQINGAKARSHQANGNGVDGDYEMSPSVREATNDPEPSPLVSTLSVGESTGVQCNEPLAKTITETTLKGSDIIHLSWSSTDPTQLLTTGGSVWRTWTIPPQPPSPTDNNPSSALSSSASSSQTQWDDICPQGGAYFVSATSRAIPDTRNIAVALEAEDGHGTSGTQVILRRDDDTQVQLYSSQEAIVLSLRWDPTMKYVLAVSVYHTSIPMVTVWEAQTARVIAEVQTSKPALDAAWVQDMQVVLCGEGFLEYIDASKNPSLVSTIDTTATWEKVRFDSIASKIACIASHDDQLALLNVDSFSIQATAMNNGQITAMEWQPNKSSSAATMAAVPAGESEPRLLATSSNNGTVKLWNARHALECVHTFSMEPAMALAFSPSGMYIAAAGAGIIKSWATTGKKQLYAVWRAAQGSGSNGIAKREVVVPQVNGDSNDINDNNNNNSNSHDHANTAKTEEGLDGPEGPYYTLAWNMDGSKLAYGRGEKISVIDLPR